MTGYAFFVKRPRTIQDLTRAHPVGAERPFETVKTVTLAGIDYENFITDMAADRQFLEDNAGLCSGDGPAVRCILVKRSGAGSGILVVPDKAWIDIAALLS